MDSYPNVNAFRLASIAFSGTTWGIIFFSCSRVIGKLFVFANAPRSTTFEVSGFPASFAKFIALIIYILPVIFSNCDKISLLETYLVSGFLTRSKVL